MASDGTIKISTKLDSKDAEKALAKFSTVAKTGLKAVATAVGTVSAGLSGMAGYAIKAGADFEAQMSRVQAISGATSSEFNKLREQALQLGADTAFSAGEAAQGMENLAAAGFETNEIMDAMPGLLDLAAASGEDLASSSDIAASTLRGFGLAASDAGHVADVLAENANRTNSSVAETGEAMKYIAPLAQAAGISLEETASAIGLMANAGIQGSQAGTTLRGALSRLSKPTDDMQQAMDELGISFYDSEGKMLSLTDQVAMLQSAMTGMTDEQKNNYMVTLYGQEALSGMLALINEGPDSLAGLTAAYEQCDGSAQAAAATMQDNLKGAVEELSGSAESLGTMFYDKVSGSLKETAQVATESVNNITDALQNGGISAAVKTAGDEFANLATMAASHAPDMVHSAVQFIQSFVSGIYSNRGQIISAAGSVALALGEGLADLLPASVSGPVKTAVKEIGKSFEGGGLRTAISTVTTTFKNFQNVVGSVAKVALPPLTATLDIVGGNFDKIVPLVAAGTAAFKTYSAVTKTVTTAKKAYTVATKALNAMEKANALQLVATNGGLTIQQTLVALRNKQITVTTALTGLWTKAQNALNVAMSSNPIGLAVTAISALAAGLGVAALMTDKASNSTEALAEKHRENIEASREAIKAIEEEAAARQKNIDASTAEIDNAEALWGELSKIVDANGQIKAGYEARAEYITGELSNALGIEIGLVDGQITNYQELEGSIYDVIAAKKAEAALSTMESDYNDAKNEQSEIMAKLTSEYDKLLEKQSAVKDIESQIAAVESQVQTEETIQRTRELEDALDAANAELQEQEAAFEAANADMEDNQKKISDYDLLMEAAMSGSTEKINSALAEIQSGINTTLDAGSDAALTQAQNVGDTLLGILDVQKSGLADIEQATIDSSAESMGIALNTMAGSSENMKLLLESIGTEGCERLLAAMQNADLAGNLSEEARSGMQAMIQAMDSMDGEMNATGEDSGDQYADGVSSSISAGASEAYTSGKSLADNADSGAKSKTGYAAGDGFGAGFVSGIAAWMASAVSAGANLAVSALQAAKDKLQSKSPAKKTIKLGRDFDQGFIIGVRKDRKKVEKETGGLAEAALKSFDLSGADTGIIDQIKNLDIASVTGQVYDAMSNMNLRIADHVTAKMEAQDRALASKEDQSGLFPERDMENLAKKIGKYTAAGVKGEMNKPIYLCTDRIDKPLPKGAVPRI